MDAEGFPKKDCQKGCTLRETQRIAIAVLASFKGQWVGPHLKAVRGQSYLTARQPGRGDFGQVLKLPHGLGNLTTGSPNCSAEHSNRREGFGGAPCMWDASPLHSSEYKLLWAGVGAKHLSQCLTSKNLTPHLTFSSYISQNVYYTIWTTRSLRALHWNASRP